MLDLRNAALRARRFGAPEFTDVLLELLPIHEEVVQKLECIPFALTTGLWLQVSTVSTPTGPEVQVYSGYSTVMVYVL